MVLLILLFTEFEAEQVRDNLWAKLQRIDLLKTMLADGAASVCTNWRVTYSSLQDGNNSFEVCTNGNSSFVGCARHNSTNSICYSLNNFHKFFECFHKYIFHRTLYRRRFWMQVWECLQWRQQCHLRQWKMARF
ncbi:uncharacterized protein LOC131641322 isoform X1 [Vicia villosa]|uniref:uncharacterized protein LOC131641322 isoform X1 n=1 Tax=Vicia villosa TaxID=3911 RepID=UPI00273B395F|nr:uncharacterized protein LOC131641322 isoform X1 [Vicia villosa]